jgi:hypothetical protein
MLEVAKKTLAYLNDVTKEKGRLSKTLTSKYESCCSTNKQADRTTIGMMKDLIALATAMMKSNRNKLRSADYQCSVGQSLLRW